MSIFETAEFRALVFYSLTETDCPAMMHLRGRGYTTREAPQQQPPTVQSYPRIRETLRGRPGTKDRRFD